MYPCCSIQHSTLWPYKAIRTKSTSPPRKDSKVKSILPFKGYSLYGEFYEHDTLHGVACDQPTMEPFDFYGCANYFG
jgi:hypothetical protein